MARTVRGDLRVDIHTIPSGQYKWALYRGATVVARGEEAYARRDSLWQGLQGLAAHLTALVGDLPKRRQK